MNAALEKNSLSEFSKAEFIEFIKDISTVKGKTESEIHRLARHFAGLIEPHPKGTDLLYWPDDGADDSAEGIATEVERFFLENSLPGFRKN